MDVVILTKAGQKLRTYDAECETPQKAASFLHRIAKRPEWVRIGSVVIWSADIDALTFPDLEADRSE